MRSGCHISLGCLYAPHDSGTLELEVCPEFDLSCASEQRGARSEGSARHAGSSRTCPGDVVERIEELALQLQIGLSKERNHLGQRQISIEVVGTVQPDQLSDRSRRGVRGYVLGIRPLTVRLDVLRIEHLDESVTRHETWADRVLQVLGRDAMQLDTPVELIERLIAAGQQMRLSRLP